MNARRVDRSLLLAVLLACAGGAHAADGPQLPWADPIGVSPTYGTATPSLPYAEPIGASQLNRPPATVAPYGDPRGRAAARSCYRARDNLGRIVTYCRGG